MIYLPLFSLNNTQKSENRETNHSSIQTAVLVMANYLHFLCVVIFLSMVIQGMGQCSLKDMSIEQSKVDKNGNNKNMMRKPKWNVTITNNCYCSQSNVKIGCKGIMSTKDAAVDPSIVKMAKGKGLVNKGEPVYPYSSVAFTYASRVPLHFKLLSSQVACS